MPTYADGPIASLYLDVWAPATATAKSALPVRVWLYGGANQAGGISDPKFDGCHVAATGVIMVAINYRLGVLGYMALESAGIGGNQGIQDILLGLRWVQDNIKAFGGDPVSSGKDHCLLGTIAKLMLPFRKQ
jgi:carboxylesterase type B